MQAEILAQLQTAAPPSHTQLACSGASGLVAAPCEGDSAAVHVWRVQNDGHSVTVAKLVGHDEAVTGACFGNLPEPRLLATASRDTVLLWNIDQRRSIRLADGLGSVRHLAMSPLDRFVCACIGPGAVVLSVAAQGVHVVLDGHDAPVTTAGFVSGGNDGGQDKPLLLVTTSEDRTWKVWDVDRRTLVHKSGVVSSSPFIAMAMDPPTRRLALAAADGLLRLYDMSPRGGFRCLCTVNVAGALAARAQQRLAVVHSTSAPPSVSTRPSWQRGPAAAHRVGTPGRSGAVKADEDGAEISRHEAEGGATVIGLRFLNVHVPGRDPAEDPALAFMADAAGSAVGAGSSGALNEQSWLVIALPAEACLLNAHTFRIEHIHGWQDDNGWVHGAWRLPLSGSCSFDATPALDGTVWCTLGSAFTRTFSVLRLTATGERVAVGVQGRGGLLQKTGTVPPQSPAIVPPCAAATAGTAVEMGHLLTMLSHTGLLEDSPLHATMTPKAGTLEIGWKRVKAGGRERKKTGLGGSHKSSHI